MLYFADGQIYLVDDGKVFGVDATAKDKVIEKRELESVTFQPKCKATLPKKAVPVTEEELILKLNLSEENPCLFKKAKED